MPTYDYLCQNCAHEFEKFQSIMARPLRKCPQCNKMGLKRLIGTGGAVIFKGSGFYETDYRSEGYKQDQQKDKPKTPEKDSKKESKTDSKSEAKTEPKPKPEKSKK